MTMLAVLLAVLSTVTPNDRGLVRADDSASIQAAVDRAAETGVGRVTIPRVNARTGKDVWTISRTILLPSDVTVVLDGARLAMADGVYENFFRNANMWTAAGRTLAGEQCNIRILGRNGATLDGAKANDLWEGTSLKDGRPHVRRNVPILMSNVRDFEVSGLRIENHRYWGLCFEYCRNGRISDLVFVARYDRRNQDGVNLRNGCTDISIEDISGQTGDDMVALSAIDRPRIDAYDTTVDGKRPDIVRVTIRNIRGAAVGHPLVALRNGNGARLADISIEGVRDADFIADGDGQDRPRYALIRIGNGMYWTTRPASLGEVANIAVRNVVCSKSVLGIVINGTLKDAYIADVSCSDPCTAAVSTAGPVWGGAGATLENVVFENCRLGGSDDPARALDAASMSAEDYFRNVSFNGVAVDRAAHDRRIRTVRFENVREEYGTYVADDPSKGPCVIEAVPMQVPVADPLLYWCIKMRGGAASSVEVATAPDCAGRPGDWSAFAAPANNATLPLKAGSWLKYRITLGASDSGARARLHHFKIGDDLHSRWLPPLWEKPKTTRRYLQGPLAERLLVAFREGKVIHGEMSHERDWRRWKYVCQPACGVWLVHGEKDEAYDFRQAVLRTDPEGVPIHGQSWRDGDVEVDFEACSPFARKPSAHIRVKLANRGASDVSERIGFIVRNSQEVNLVFGAPDIYRVYNPRVRSWKGLDCAWRRDGDAIVLQDLFVSFRGDSAATWDAEEGVLRFPVELKAGETKTYDLVLGRQDAVVRPDYESAREQTRADWRKELAKAKDLPLLEKCLLVQILQCYARANRGDVILPRQGGLQRWVWPWDQSYAAGALTMLGYGEYVEMACDFYFGEYANPDGSVGPFGMGWVNDTANVLGIFSRHCAETGNAAFWQKHRAAAERAFRWMKAERAKSANLPGQVAGLFPAGVASDNPKVFQSWGTTDLLNLQGLELYVRAARKFGDPAADEAAAEAADYRATIAKILDRWRAASADTDTFSIPYKPDGSDQQLLRDSGYFYMHPSYFALFGFLDAADMQKVRKYMLQEGLANERGLYFHHAAKGDPELGDHVWYTTASEYGWFFAWRRVGRDDLAQQALDACLRYSVTDEYQVGERMHDANPWYFPWSPNASGAGRILQMLHAGDKKSAAARDFCVTDYGARADGTKSTAAFAAAIAAASEAGGGRVVVPDGTWTVGSLKLRSNVELHLSDGAVLAFTDDPADYLPSVPRSTTGIECMGWSSPIYAYGCTNVALTGHGTLAPKMDYWRSLMRLPGEGKSAVAETLYHWCATNAPLAARDLTKLPPSSLGRPALLHFNRCQGVRLDGLRIRQSPYWVIHFFLSDEVTVRNVDLFAYGCNNDALDIEMTSNVRVEDCTFFSGDDGICLKAGRNADGWRLGKPTENVTVRRCDIRSAHSVLACGSELSAGIRNVLVEDCTAESVRSILKIKTNDRRGGFVRDVTVRNVRARHVDAVFRIAYDGFRWKFPDYELRETAIENLLMENVSVHNARDGIVIPPRPHLPPKGIVLRNIEIDRVCGAKVSVPDPSGVTIGNVNVREPGVPRTGIVFDRIENADRYASISPNFAKAIAFLKRPDLQQLAPGRYEIDGKEVFANVQDVRLKPVEDATAEIHRDYADIQMTFGKDGHGGPGSKEFVGFGDLPDGVAFSPFKPGSDVAKAKAVLPVAPICENIFLIAFPGAVHAPNLTDAAPWTERKICIKVRSTGISVGTESGESRK